MTGHWTTIRTYSAPVDAELARAHLESEGIEAIVLDVHQSSLQPLHAFATGGVRLQVSSEAAQRAVQILEHEPDSAISEEELTRLALGEEEFDSESPEPLESPVEPGLDEPSAELPSQVELRCPVCAASNIGGAREGLFQKLAGLFDGPDAPRRRCRRCGHRW